MVAGEAQAGESSKTAKSGNDDDRPFDPIELLRRLEDEQRRKQEEKSEDSSKDRLPDARVWAPPELLKVGKTAEGDTGAKQGEEAKLAQLPTQVQAAVKQARSMSAAEKASLGEYQNDLEKISSLNSAGGKQKALIGALRDEREGIVRGADGQVVAKLNQPYYGPASQEMSRLVYQQVLKDMAPTTIGALLESGANIPPGLPVKTPVYTEDPFAGKTMPPEVFLRQVAEGTRQLELSRQHDRPPTDKERSELNALLRWNLAAQNEIGRIEETKALSIAKQELKENNFPASWKVDSFENAIAAMALVSQFKECRNLVQAVQQLAPKMKGSSGEAKWLSMIDEKNLPPGIELVRDSHGKVIGMNAKGLPNDLDPHSPELREYMRNLKQWCDVVSTKVEAGASELERSGKSKFAAHAWMDISLPNGWINQDDPDLAKTQVEQQSTSPGDGNWVPANQIRRRCKTEEVFDKTTGNLTGILIEDTTSFRRVPLLGAWDLISLPVEGLKDIVTKTDPKDPLDPDRLVAVQRGDGSRRLLPAKELQGYMNEQKFWHIVGKTTTIVMDISMLASGYGAFRQAKQGFQTIAAGVFDKTTMNMVVHQAEKRGLGEATYVKDILTTAGKGSAERAKLLDDLAGIFSTQRRHGIKQMAFGSTFLLNTSYAAETPVLRELGLTRALGMSLDIATGTLAPALQFMRGKASLNGAELIAHLISSTAPAHARTIGKAGHIGAAVATPIMLFELSESILHHLSRERAVVIPKVGSEGADDPQAGKKVERKSTSGQGISDALTKYLDNLELSPQQRADLEPVAKQVKDLLQPPLLADGSVDKEHLAEWKQKRRDLIDKQIAPKLLLSPQAIADREIARVEKLGLLNRELDEKRAFTEQDVHRMEQAQRNESADKNELAFYSAALLCLSRDENGQTESSEGAQPGSLYERDSVIPSWSYGPKPFQIKVPLDDSQRTMKQSLQADELMRNLESQMLRPNQESRRFAAGELATRLGLEPEVYTATLQEVISNKETAPEKRRDAMIRLAAIGYSASRWTADESAQEQSTIAATAPQAKTGANIQAFLARQAATQTDIDSKALAVYLSATLDRRRLDETDVERLRQLEKADASFGYQQLVATALSDLQGKAGNVAALERKAQAIRSLGALMDKTGHLPALADLPNLPDRQELQRLSARLVQESLAHSESLAVKDERKRFAELEERLSAAEKEGKDKDSLSAELVKQDVRLRQVELERALSIEVALESARDLVKPDQSGSGGVGPSLLQSNTGSDQRLLLQTIEDLMGQLKSSLPTTPLFAGRDITLRNESLQVLSKLVKAGEAGSVPPDLQERRAKSIESFLGLVQATAAGQDSPALSGAAYAEARRSALTHSTLVQVAAHPAVPELRQTAIEILAEMKDSRGFKILMERMQPETEPNPNIRLTAAKYLSQVAPGGQAEAKRFAWSLLDRQDDKGNKPRETDASVLTGLRKYFPPTVAQASLERQRDVEDRAQKIARLPVPTHEELKQLIASNKDEYGWLTAEELRKEIVKAKSQANPDRLSYNLGQLADALNPTRVVDAVKVAVGTKDASEFIANQSDPRDREATRQREALQEYQRRFNKLAATAFSDSGIKGEEARNILYYFAAYSVADAKPSEADIQALKDVGLTDSNKIVDETVMRSFQRLAANALADSAINNGSPEAVNPGAVRQLESLFVALLQSNDVPTSIKSKMVEALSSLSDRTDSKGGVRTERLYTSEMLTELDKITGRLISTGTPASQNGNSQMRTEQHELGMRILDYVSRHRQNDNTLRQLESIILSVTGSRTSGDPLPASICQRCRDIVMDAGGKATPAATRQSLKADERLGRQSRLELLAAVEELSLYAHKASANQKDKELLDRLAELQKDRDQEAVAKLSSALATEKISTSDPELGAKLERLLELPGVSQTVQEASALALLRHSSVPGHRQAAIAKLAHLSTKADSLALRLEAQEMIESLTLAQDLQSAETALDKQLSAAPSDATALSLLARVQNAQGKQSEAAENVKKSLEAFSKTPGEAILPRSKSGWLQKDELVSALGARYGSSEHLLRVAQTYETLARVLSQTGEHRDARDLMEAIQKLRTQYLGQDHHATVQGHATQAMVFRNSALDIERTVAKLETEQRRQQIYLEDLLSAAKMLDAVPSGELSGGDKSSRDMNKLMLQEGNETSAKMRKTIESYRQQEVSFLEQAVGKQREHALALHEQKGPLHVSTLNAVTSQLELREKLYAARQRLAESATDSLSKRDYEQRAATERQEIQEDYYTGIDTRARLLGYKSHAVLDLRSKLGDFLFRQGQYQESKRQHLIVADALTSVVSKERADCQHAVALCELKLGRSAAAEAFFEKELTTASLLYKKAPEELVKVMQRQALDKSAHGQYEAARKQMYEIMAAHNSRDQYLRIADDFKLLAGIQRKHGYVNEAIESEKAALETLQEEKAPLASIRQSTIDLARWQAVNGLHQDASRTIGAYLNRAESRDELKKLIDSLSSIAPEHNQEERSRINALICSLMNKQ